MHQIKVLRYTELTQNTNLIAFKHLPSVGNSAIYSRESPILSLTFHAIFWQEKGKG